MRQKYTQLFVIILLLESCAGGGGGSSSPLENPTPPPDPGPSYEVLKAQYESNYEYQQQYGLALANASSAYARGSTGKNVTIGITDSGLDISHVEIDPDRINPGSYLSYSNYTPNTRQKRHGTMVASVAAGILSENTDTPMHGVAFDADIFFIAIQLAEPDDTYEPIDLGDGDGGSSDPDFTGVDSFFENLFQVYTSRGIEIVNNSYGYSGNIIDYNESAVRNAFPKTIAAISQIFTPPADKTIFVWAAGNAGSYADQGVDYSSPEIFPGMAYFIEEIQGHSIAVVSVDEDGEISDFSSRCGVAANFCIAAPGGRVVGAYPTSLDDMGIYDSSDDCVNDNSCYALISGTSFAAPFVSGALAVLFEHFEGQLGSTEIVSRLFATANDEGIYSDSSIYGHGLIDLEAATNPMGTMSVAMTNSVFGQMAPLLETGLDAYNPILGNSILRSLQNKSLIAFDELGSPFRIPVGKLIASSTNGSITLNSSGIFSSPKVDTYNDNGITYQLIQRTPLNHRDSLISNHFLGFSEINQSLNIIDGVKQRLLVYGENDNTLYTPNSFYKSYDDFENPYLDFTKYGVLYSQTFDIKNLELTWVASIGKPKINIEEIFHDSSINTQLSVVLSGKFLPNIQFGWLNEKDKILGLGSSGAFNFSKNTDSVYAGFNKTLEFKNTLFSFTAFKSFSLDNTFNESLIKGTKNIETSFYNFEFIFPNIFFGANLEIGYKRPLFVSRGELELELPVYRDRYHTLYTERFSIPLTSGAKESISSIKLSHQNKNRFLSLAIESYDNPYHRNIFEDYINFSIGFRYLF